MVGIVSIVGGHKLAPTWMPQTFFNVVSKPGPIKVCIKVIKVCIALLFVAVSRFC